MKEQTSIRLPKELKENIQEDAQKERRSFTAQLIVTLERYYEGKDK